MDLGAEDEGVMPLPCEMLKERLEKYFVKSKEIELLRSQIADEKNKLEIAGTYQYSDPRTFQQREREIYVATGKIPNVISMTERMHDLYLECSELETIVFNIPDSEMRQILRIAYLNGGRERRWERVADHFGREITGESYRKKAGRYIDKLEMEIKSEKASVMSAKS